MKKYDYQKVRNRKSLYDKATIEKMVEENWNLVPWTYEHKILKNDLIRRHRDDILSEGYIALWEACQSYNPNKGTIATFAVLHIYRRMVRYINIFLTDIEMKLIDDGYSITHLDELTNYDDGNVPYEQITPSPNNKFDELDDKMFCNAFIKLLTPNEQVILDLFKQGYNMREIGDMYHVSRERIRQIFKSVSNKFKLYENDEIKYAKYVTGKRANQEVLAIRSGTMTKELGMSNIPSKEKALSDNNGDIGIKISSNKLAAMAGISHSTLDYARMNIGSQYYEQVRDRLHDLGYELFVVYEPATSKKSNGNLVNRMYIKEIKK